MRWVAILLFTAGFWAWLHSVANRNSHRETLNEALTAEDYTAFIQSLENLPDSLQFGDPEGQFPQMLGHAYYTLGTFMLDSVPDPIEIYFKGSASDVAALMAQVDSLAKYEQEGATAGIAPFDSARRVYESLRDFDHLPTRSNALNQIGVIKMAAAQYKSAQLDFRTALEADRTNDAARYNLELVTKLLKTANSQGQPEPSEYARQLKDIAMELVRDQEYAPAYYLLMAGRWHDPTARQFEPLANRIKDIWEIEKKNASQR